MKDKKYLERIINYSNKIIRYLEEITSIEEFESNCNNKDFRTL